MDIKQAFSLTNALTAASVAFLGAKYLIEPNVFGNGFATTFLLAFVLTSCGLAMLLGIREPEPPRTRAASGVRDRLRELPALLRSDRGFTRYFIARALATMGRMAVPFYFVYADNTIGGSTSQSLAILTPCFLLANSTINLPWGWMADRTGFRLVFLLSIGVWITSVLLLMTSTTIVGFVPSSKSGLASGINGTLARLASVLAIALFGPIALRFALIRSKEANL